MNTLPDKGVIIGRIPTDQKVVGSTPAECANRFKDFLIFTNSKTVLN